MRVALGPTAREEVIIDEPPRHQAYVLVSGLPARDYRGDVWICDQSGGSVITWEVGFNPAYPATGSIIRLVMRWSIVLFAAALARQAERMATGEG